MAASLSGESPFQIQISFHKLLESLEEIALSDVDYRSNYAKGLLKQIEPLPEFRTGISDLSIIEKNETLIKYLLADLFPTALTNNEIKAVSIPFQNFTFNYSERFKKILKDAGVTFDANFRDFNNDQFYIMSCCLILNSFYKQNIDFNSPLFYDIPDADGIIKHYRILYNADFVEIIPTEKALPISQNDIDILLDSYENIALWKAYFPEKSWLMKGFGIVQLFDATIESAVSILKGDLLKSDAKKDKSNKNFEDIFRSIYKIPDLKVGFTVYNELEKKLIHTPYESNDIPSFILDCNNEVSSDDAMIQCFYQTIIENKEPFTISNVANFVQHKENKLLGNHLLKQNIQSCILYPIVKNNKLMGIIELASEKPKVLNSLNANKLSLILPFLIDTIDRYNIELENQIEAVVQKEYTAIHPSVYWKFTKEAKKYLETFSNSKDYSFKEIVFKEVYPLFGGIDIKGSSEHRNLTVKEDLKNQLTTLLTIIENLNSHSNLVLLEQKKFELQNYINEVEQPLRADTEQQIQNYVEQEIHPIIRNADLDEETQLLTNKYFKKIDEITGMFYHSRKKFDNSLSIINKKLASILDEKQIDAQQIFPHYYERFKTDGVEHNLYIGASIDPSKKFEKMYLNNLRLWQLQTLCEMELEHHKLKKELPYSLDVTSLILVFSSPITIRFRMDEKRFDVDGAYNARYEVVKKRIDKAHIKNTDTRITEKEKITIVYSHKHEEAEYLNYIKYLQFKNIIENEIEQFEIEDLQGVSGLKGIRVKVINQEN